jgi:hypothetical protein
VHVFPEVSTLATNIKRVSLEHYAAWSLNLHPVKEVWSKPPQGFCKVNIDATVREGYSTQAAICRNSIGEIIKVLTQVRPPYSPVYGEVLAAQLTGVLANSLHLDQFILEGDSSIVFLSLQNPSLSIDWHIENVINETLSSFQVSSTWEARKINGSVNFYVHYAAYRAATTVLPDYIPSLFFPNSILICSGKDLPPFPSFVRVFWFCFGCFSCFGFSLFVCWLFLSLYWFSVCCWLFPACLMKDQLQKKKKSAVAIGN